MRIPEDQLVRCTVPFPYTERIVVVGHETEKVRAVIGKDRLCVESLLEADGTLDWHRGSRRLEKSFVFVESEQRLPITEESELVSFLQLGDVDDQLPGQRRYLVLGNVPQKTDILDDYP